MEASRPLDVAVFGATGFTGRLVAEYLAGHAPDGVRVGLAGRSEEKLAEVRAGLGDAASEWPLALADSSDVPSLVKLAEAARVVVTTVGPYAQSGLPLVEACTAAGTHYADLAGEVLFIRDSIDRFHEPAAESGARIVHACGFDSIPSDLGVLLLHEAARADGAGDLEDTTLVVKAVRGGLSGGTLASMKGLIDEVRSKHPHMVRIILSGYTEVESALRAVSVAHQFLAKPCDGPELERVVERCCSLQGRLHDDAVRTLVSAMGDLPSAPHVYTELTARLADPEASLDEIASVIETDVAMCAKVLQLVNSSFFGLGRTITTVREAVVYLGVAVLKALALSAGAFRTLDPGREIEGYPLDAASRHASLVARTAALLPEQKRAAEDAFIGGMLHDIGKLVMAARKPEEFTALVAEAQRSGVPLYELEQQRYGITHADVGAYLLDLWGLPYEIVEAVANHHTPIRGSRELDAAAAVYLANALASEHSGTISAPADGRMAELEADYLAALGAGDRLRSWRAIAAQQAWDIASAA